MSRPLYRPPFMPGPIGEGLVPQSERVSPTGFRSLGGGGGGGAAPFDPLTDTDVIEYWDDWELSNGLVASMTGKRLGTVIASAGALQPTKSATAINGTPGITYGGAHQIKGAINLTGYSSLTVAFGLLATPPAATSIIVEHGTNFASINGSFAIGTNLSSGGLLCLSGGARGTVNIGVRNTANQFPLDALGRTVMVTLDTSRADGVSMISHDRDPVYGLVSATSTCSPGAFANQTLHIGARGASATFPITGSMTGLMLIKPTASEAKLDAIRAWYLARMGYTRDFGTIFWPGDSTQRGLNGDIGGSRVKFQELCVADAIRFKSGGPYTTGGTSLTQKYHGGLGGATLSDRLPFTPGYTTQSSPRAIVWVFGINDLESGIGVTAYLNNYTAMLDAVDAVAPNVLHFITSIQAPTGSAFAADYAAANAAFPAFCAARARCTFVSIGAMATSDGTHFVDGPTGYDIAGQAIFNAISAAS